LIEDSFRSLITRANDKITTSDRGEGGGGNLERRFLIAVSAAVITLLVGSLLYYSIVTAQGPGDYDHWYDINDDGKIDMKDIGAMARKFGTTGTPINKTALLLELEQNITVLREEMIALQLWVGRTVVDMIYDLNATIEQRLPQRPIVSIPAAAFTPGPKPGYPYVHQLNDWQNWGRYLWNLNDTLHANFYAPVQLPHGVNVTRVYIFWLDWEVSSVECYLYKSEANHTLDSYWEMAYLQSPEKGAPGWGSSNTNIIEHSIIDNYYQYYLRVRLPPADETGIDYIFYYAIIAFEYPE
jgi:hypothetical protein